MTHLPSEWNLSKKAPYVHINEGHLINRMKKLAVGRTVFGNGFYHVSEHYRHNIFTNLFYLPENPRVSPLCLLSFRLELVATDSRLAHLQTLFANIIRLNTLSRRHSPFFSCKFHEICICLTPKIWVHISVWLIAILENLARIKIIFTINQFETTLSPRRHLTAPLHVRKTPLPQWVSWIWH